MSFRKMLGCGSCRGESKNGEQVAIWVGVGTVFFTLFLTTALGPRTKAAVETQREVESEPAEAESMTEERVQEHLESFDFVWNTVNDRHWDPEYLESVDWAGARDELRPRVEQAANDDEAAGLMRELLERLRLSHYQIIPAAAYDEEMRSGGDGVSGISVRILDGQAVVFRVAEGSPADEAGVQPGWVVESIGAREASVLLDRLVQREEATGDRAGVMSSLVFDSQLTGAVGETLEVVFLDGADAKRSVEITLAESPDPMFEAANLPAMPVHISSSVLDGSVVYFTFSAFMDPARLMSSFEEAVNEARERDGLVIDLRGNLGGIIALCNGLGGWLLTDTPSAMLGQLEMRQSDLKLVMNRRANPLRKPVAVLIDERSISSAEILSGGLKDTGVARIFGSTSAGMSLPSVVQKLPNGDSFQFAISNYTSASGRVLEKNGVEPDVETPLTRAALLEGRDPALEAALRWIRAQSN